MVSDTSGRRWLRSVMTAAMAILIAVGAAFAQQRGTEAEAQKMVQDAITHVKQVGAQKAFEEFSARDGKWQHKDLYVFCYNMTGTCVCQGDNRALIGKNLFDFKSPDGQYIFHKMAEVSQSQGSGWMEYQWVDPMTKKMTTKRTFFTKIPGYDGYLGVGVFK